MLLALYLIKPINAKSIARNSNAAKPKNENALAAGSEQKKDAKAKSTPGGPRTGGNTPPPNTQNNTESGSSSKSKTGFATTQLINFQPAILKLAASPNGQAFTVALKEAPQGIVTMTFETSRYVRLERCQITFSPQNFSQAQTINAYASGDVVTTGKSKDFSTEIKVAMFCASTDSKFNRVQQVYKVERGFVESRRCSSVGKFLKL